MLCRVKCEYHKKHNKSKEIKYTWISASYQDEALKEAKKKFKLMAEEENWIIDKVELSLDPGQKKVCGQNIDYLKDLYLELVDKMEYDYFNWFGDRIIYLLGDLSTLKDELYD